MPSSLRIRWALWGSLIAVASLATAVALAAFKPRPELLRVTVPAGIPVGAVERESLPQANAFGDTTFFLAHVAADRWLALSPAVAHDTLDTPNPHRDKNCDVQWEPASDLFIGQCFTELFSIADVRVADPAPHNMWTYPVCLDRSFGEPRLVVDPTAPKVVTLPLRDVSACGR